MAGRAAAAVAGVGSQLDDVPRLDLLELFFLQDDSVLPSLGRSGVFERLVQARRELRRSRWRRGRGVIGGRSISARAASRGH